MQIALPGWGGSLEPAPSVRRLAIIGNHGVEDDMDDLWQIERRLWLEGVEAYREHMSETCLMVFGPMGIMRGEQILKTLEGAPRWAELRISDETTAAPSSDVRVLAYKADAERAGAEPYHAYCSSTYVKGGRGWQLVQHQQTAA
jgi:hypothetical protein